MKTLTVDEKSRFVDISAEVELLHKNTQARAELNSI